MKIGEKSTDIVQPEVGSEAEIKMARQHVVKTSQKAYAHGRKRAEEDTMKDALVESEEMTRKKKKEDRATKQKDDEESGTANEEQSRETVDEYIVQPKQKAAGEGQGLPSMIVKEDGKPSKGRAKNKSKRKQPQKTTEQGEIDVDVDVLAENQEVDTRASMKSPRGRKIRVNVTRIPENQQYIIKGIDPRNETLQDLKKRIAVATSLPPFKQRLLDSENKEYVGSKDSPKKLHEYGIKDSEMIHVELRKLNLRIILPSLDELDLTVDPRKHDLKKVRDYVFKKYYRKREVPKKDLMPMMIDAKKLDDEPGETKLIEYGILQDGVCVSLKPCFITIETPIRVIYCPNADPFYDNLDVLKKFVESEGINVDDLHVEYNGQKMRDFTSILYDLKIGDGSKVIFLK